MSGTWRGGTVCAVLHVTISAACRRHACRTAVRVEEDPVIRTICLLGAILAMGCGGQTLGGPGDDGGPGSDAGPGTDGGRAWSPVCPEDQPALKSACSKEGLVCEYGKLNYDPSCDTIVQCFGGKWGTASGGLGSSGSCQPDGPNPSSCPATYAGVQAIGGGPCDDEGIQCEYPQGVCWCTAGFGGLEVPDAGATWTCAPGDGCPMPRPRIGTACTGHQNCTYEPCEFTESCAGGYWQGAFEACAGLATGG
jgi:hypothetical protein